VRANKSLIIDAAIIVALLLVGAGGYHFSPLLLPKSDVAATPEPGCDLQRGACGAALPGGGRIELSLAPRPIPNVQPLAVEVSVSGIETHKVMIDLAGAKMNMGVNRTELTETAPGRFTGTTSLPVCVTGAMDWVATVVMESGRQRISAPFRFTSLPH
jgi:hypothetical protein